MARPTVSRALRALISFDYTPTGSLLFEKQERVVGKSSLFVDPCPYGCVGPAQVAPRSAKVATTAKLRMPIEK
jgi:hypothetical protein